MSVTTSTMAALQEKNIQIDGVTSAPVVYPSSLDSGDLPCIMIIPAEGRSERDGGWAAQQDTFRTYRHVVFIAPESQNERNDNMQQAIALMDAMAETWLNPENTVFYRDEYQIIVHVEEGLRDTGLNMMMRWGGVNYYGFEMLMTVRTHR